MPVCIYKFIFVFHRHFVKQSHPKTRFTHFPFELYLSTHSLYCIYVFIFTLGTMFALTVHTRYLHNDVFWYVIYGALVRTDNTDATSDQYLWDSSVNHFTFISFHLHVSVLAYFLWTSNHLVLSIHGKELTHSQHI